MSFDDLFEKYIQNSTCNIDQAKFIWNAAINAATGVSEDANILAELLQPVGVNVIDKFNLK